MSTLRVSLAVLCTFLAGTALAQEAPAPAQEPATPADTGTGDTVEMPLLEVIGTPERKDKLPGSAQVIDRNELELSRVMTTNEALRKATGVNVRDEEGLGLRPNIGIRGLNPTRSTKVLLLEDGIPLAFAPYGDNASYYHPPVDRFDRIEILKGAGQNIYGPQTVGGVINYITPAPPLAFTGGVRLTSGNREYFNGHGFIGGNDMVLDYVRKQGDAARDNTHSDLNDVNYKAVFGLGGGQALTARANYYSEDSQLTYSGLTNAEYANYGAEYNPFENDEFKTDRQGASLTHEMPFGAATLITNLYGSRFNRDWWRQSSTTTDTTCGAGFRDARLAGSQVDPDSCNANIGNLREYLSYGVEPRVTLPHSAFGEGGELQAGVRVHFEEQERVGQTGSTSDAREGVTNREDKRRRNAATSAFVQNRFAFGSVALIPAVRIERISYEITNRCPDTSASPGADGIACTDPTVTADDSLTEWVPSLGATWSPSPFVTVFAGAHRGFAPPTTGDLLNETTGLSRELDAEESWNYELGARTRLLEGLTVEATAFLNDFERQIAVGSIAGGSTPLAVGETRYEGAELLARTQFGALLGTSYNPFLELAYTWLPTAEQATPFIQASDGVTPVPGSAAGKRLPYAPEHLLTAAVGLGGMMGVDVRLEAVYVGSQYADFANTESPAANTNGQVGEIASYTIWNASVNYKLPGTGFGVFATAKNLFDKVYIVDRTRGILPGAPQLVQAGVEYTFQ